MANIFNGETLKFTQNLHKKFIAIWFSSTLAKMLSPPLKNPILGLNLDIVYLNLNIVYVQNLTKIVFYRGSIILELLKIRIRVRVVKKRETICLMSNYQNLHPVCFNYVCDVNFNISI